MDKNQDNTGHLSPDLFELDPGTVILKPRKDILQQRDEALHLLEHLLYLKREKDGKGKTERYLKEMPEAWKKVEELLSRFK